MILSDSAVAAERVGHDPKTALDAGGLIADLKNAIRAQESRNAVLAKAGEIVALQLTMQFKTPAKLVEQKVAETLTYYAYASKHRPQIHIDIPLGRMIREIRRRTRLLARSRTETRH